MRLIHNFERFAVVRALGGAARALGHPPPLCGGSALAVTKPGSPAVLVCGSRFVRQAERSARYAEAVRIHEALHSLGLGENPPSSDYITERIRARCG